MKKLRFEGQNPKGHELKSFDEMEGEDMMEKCLRGFQARSNFVFDWAKLLGHKYHCAMGPGWFDAIKE